jgi:membrane-associated phospholipid phosphatase
VRIPPPLTAAIASAVLLVVLDLLVAPGSTHHLDVVLRDRWRPDDVWGPDQRRAGFVTDLIGPPTAAAFLLLVASHCAVRKRSWRPLMYAGLVAVAGGTLAWLLKLQQGRTDPHGDLSSIGSFPSGHVTALLVCVGAAVLVHRERTRWWEWLLVAAAGAVMIVGLLLQATHWFTDLAGGALLALAVLGAAAVLPLRFTPPRGSDGPGPKPGTGAVGDTGRRPRTP